MADPIHQFQIQKVVDLGAGEVHHHVGQLGNLGLGGAKGELDVHWNSEV